MRRCILHVGSHKTGSTSIQKSLLAGVASPKFDYVDFGQSNGSVPLMSIFKDSPETYKFYRQQGWSQNKVDRYCKYYKSQLEKVIRNSDKDLILSGEDLIGLTEKELANLNRYFNNNGFIVEIMVYFRPWHNWLESLFNESCKHGTTNFFGIMPPGKIEQLQSDRLNYRQSIEKFDKIFGENNVHVFVFNAALFPKGCVVTHFCRQLQLEAVSQYVYRANDSMSLLAVKILYHYNHYVHEKRLKGFTKRDYRLFLKKLEQVKSNPIRFHSSLTERLLEPYRIQREWIEKRTGDAFEEKFSDGLSYAIRNQEDMMKFTLEEVLYLNNKMNSKLHLQTDSKLSIEDIVSLIKVFETEIIRNKFTGITVERVKGFLSKSKNFILKEIKTRVIYLN